jgi:hypothetical protein
MGLFSRQPTAAAAVQPHLADPQWFAASRAAYESLVADYYGSPESMARGGLDRPGSNEAGIALHFFAKSIDMLHTAYGYNAMRTREPSGDDSPIVGAFCDTLAVIMRNRPTAPVDEVVREVTHRLRSISTTCDGMGLGSNLYRWGLDTMGRLAPQVRVDDIFWH